jgi:hypothetical protein
MVGVGDDDSSVPNAELFLDERGTLLRARWSVSSLGEVVVELSVWRHGRCVATHRLPAADAERLSSLLQRAGAGALTSAETP